MSGPPPPGPDERVRWYIEETALVITTLKWALLGVVAGLCVGPGPLTRPRGLARVDAR